MGARFSIRVGGYVMGAFSIGFAVTLLVRTTRGRASKSLVCAAATVARASAQQATNKPGNSLRAITGFLRSPYSIFFLLAQREVRANPFYSSAPPWDNSQCDRFKDKVSTKSAACSQDNLSVFNSSSRI